MNLDEVLHYRRSVRAYDKTKLIDPERIKHYLELATLAPKIVCFGHSHNGEK